MVLGGEHPFDFWSRVIHPESPRIGYAPPESRTKRWAQESPIEGWFPRGCGEPCGCDVIRDAKGERIASHGGPGRGGSSLSLQRAQSCLPSVNPPGSSAEADAGCKTERIRWQGRSCLDILPHRKKFQAPFAPVVA
jgi:hypothetical protein